MFLLMALFSILSGQSKIARYESKSKSPVIEELKNDIKKENAEKDSVTQIIIDKQDELKADKKAKKLVLHADFSKLVKPKNIESFKSQFHFKPVAQYLSGMCWCYSSTSFLESEVKRITGQEIKLSELHTVYYEYLQKIEGYVDTRGNSEFGEGSESNATLRVMKKYGAVPDKVYDGQKKFKRHNHSQMFKDIKNYLHYCKENDYWEKDVILATTKAILDQTIGTPPNKFEWKGKEYTPLQFKENVLKINTDDYLGFMSTMSVPFYTQAEFDVPDNWWHDASYYNVPLDVWYSIVKKSLKAGYTITIGGDVSEPGYNGLEDAAFVPDFIMPEKYINQYSREYGIFSGTTNDDHGIHMVGYTSAGKGKNKHDWYLIKDSGRSSRKGKYHGYYMYREDFIKFKMLTFMVHKDMVKDVLKKF